MKRPKKGMDKLVEKNPLEQKEKKDEGEAPKKPPLRQRIKSALQAAKKGIKSAPKTIFKKAKEAISKKLALFKFKRDRKTKYFKYVTLFRVKNQKALKLWGKEFKWKRGTKKIARDLGVVGDIPPEHKYDKDEKDAKDKKSILDEEDEENLTLKKLTPPKLKKSNFFDKLMGKLFKIKKGLEDRSLMDQDALNIGFAGHVKLLPCRFNYLHGITTSVKNKVLTVEQINKLYGTDYTSVDAAKSDIVIYHYAGWTKPWRPMQETWKKRLEKSRILDERNDRKFVSVIQSKKEDISKVKSDTSLQKKPQTIKQEVVTKNGHDAVFVLGDGSLYQDKELAFAIHSMRKFCPFIDRIFIVGAKPRCSLKGMNCIHILCRDVMSTNKDPNMMFKVFHAIKTIPDLTDDFLLCSDDQLVTKPCTWEDFKPKYVCKFCKDSQMFLKLRSSSTWGYKLYNTLLKVQQSGRKAYFYEPHIWSPVNKEAFKDMFIAIGGSINAGVIKSQYYNSILGLDHEKLHDHAFFDSPSLDWSDAFKNPPKFISYNDKAFDSEAFRQQLMMLLK